MQGKDFKLFDNAELISAINVSGGAEFSRKKLDKLIDFVKTPQIGATGLIYCKYNKDGSSKSTIDKFFDEFDRKSWAELANCKSGDLLLIMAGEKEKTRKALGAFLRLHLAEELGMRNPKEFAPLWVLDFPLLEWDERDSTVPCYASPFYCSKK